jgi:hypothetical protein
VLPNSVRDVPSGNSCRKASVISGPYRGISTPVESGGVVLETMPRPSLGRYRSDGLRLLTEASRPGGLGAVRDGAVTCPVLGW